MLQFIKDLKGSSIYKHILEDPQIEVIMLWITGSTLTGIYDENSDYDLCAVVIDRPKEEPTAFWHKYSRPCSYFAYYKPVNKKVQCIYNDLDDITKISSMTPLDNIGWAQFKEITPEFIIYKNPKYLKFIDFLLSKKIEIFSLSAYLFACALLKSIESTKLQDLLKVHPTQPNKALAHVCWLVDTLQERTINQIRLLKIKRTPVEHLTEEDILYIKTALDYLENYASTFNAELLKEFNLRNYLEATND